jgi:hypothetical protein
LARELLISAGPGEWRAALLEEGTPVELYVERGDRSEAGSIHLGRVARLLPALGAALVDIGGDRPAFLPQRDVLPRGRRLHKGERVVVQIRREAQAGKAASLTMAATLRGRLVELILGRPGLKGGEALSPDERNQLLSRLKTLTHPSPGGAGSPLSRKSLAMHRHPHPPSAGALGPPSPAVRERSFAVVGLQPLSRTAGEGGERSEPGEGSASAEFSASVVRARRAGCLSPNTYFVSLPIAGETDAAKGRR